MATIEDGGLMSEPKASVSALPAYLVRGDDEVLVGESVHALVRELLGDNDPGLAAEELSGDDYQVAAVVEAAQTPPFLTERRVVVARDVGRFSTEELRTLVDYLGDPLPTTSVVLVAGGGRLATTLVSAVKKVGHVVDAGVSSRPRERHQWFTEQLKDAPVALDSPARQLVVDHLGEDVNRLGALLRLLEAAHGTGAHLGPEEVEPFLGSAGGVPPWDLTDAIDGGDVGLALSQLQRVLGNGARHPLEVMAILQGHYARILRLAGSGIVDEAEAATVVGGSAFPARKALAQASRLGADGVARAVELLARADLDLKGARDLPGELVLEILVARLARLSPSGRPATRKASRRS